MTVDTQDADPSELAMLVLKPLFQSKTTPRHEASPGASHYLSVSPSICLSVREVKSDLHPNCNIAPPSHLKKNKKLLSAVQDDFRGLKPEVAFSKARNLDQKSLK